MSTYRNYFDIDPTYFPAVNADVIKKNPDLWKKFYPHETFVKLVRDVVSVLSRKQKLNVWVEGAYGTGKSHAVLTLKRFLDASEEDTKEYFEQFDKIFHNLIDSSQVAAIIMEPVQGEGGYIVPDREFVKYIRKICDDNGIMLIFDEVQEVPRALASLKYFCENAPQYHIVCAGSLLGIALHEGTSFPVGKVDFLKLYPLSFQEFQHRVQF